jgi:hypothetical protein
MLPQGHIVQAKPLKDQTRQIGPGNADNALPTIDLMQVEATQPVFKPERGDHLHRWNLQEVRFTGSIHELDKMDPGSRQGQQLHSRFTKKPPKQGLKLARFEVGKFRQKPIIRGDFNQ